MAQKTLRDILAHRPEDTGTLRWRTTVPLATNLFLLLELCQLAFLGAVIVLLTLCVGVWIMEAQLAAADIITSLRVAGVVLLAVIGGFISISALFFCNKYYATYQMDSVGIYHEATRGSDTRKKLFCLRFRPFPVVGNVSAKRTRSRHLSWDKVDRFQDIVSMRVILLQRGRWHMLRLYTPDAETHGKVVQYLAERLRQI